MKMLNGVGMWHVNGSSVVGLHLSVRHDLLAVVSACLLMGEEEKLKIIFRRFISFRRSMNRVFLFFFFFLNSIVFLSYCYLLSECM